MNTVIKKKCLLEEDSNEKHFFYNTIKEIPVPFWFNFTRWEFLNKIVKLDENDAIICSYPKNGTTLLEQIVLLVMNGIEKKNYLNPANRNSYTSKNNFGKFWIEGQLSFTDISQQKYNLEFEPEGETIDYDVFLNAKNKIIKTHAPLKLFLNNGYSNNKILLITRNPLDTCVSQYYHHVPVIEKQFNTKLTFEIWTSLWLDGLVPWGSWFDWTKEWYNKYKENKNILWIHYEDLIMEPKNKIVEIAQFLEKEVNENEINEIITEVSFENMRNQYNRNTDSESVDKFNHLRKGIVGDWRRHYDENMYAKFISKYKTEFENIDLRYYLGNNDFLY